MRALGVGLTYWPVLSPLFEGDTPAAAVLELEPQTLWTKVATAAGWQYRCNEALLARVAALPQAKLLHGVGQPLAGATRDPLPHRSLLRQAADALRVAWVSEHLSFNRVRRQGGVQEAGFLLPPRQRPAAVRVAADAVRRYGRALGRPVAFETGVNYLRPQRDEMSDGDFFAAVSQAAGCGIVLDLHNLWCNERNGRQRMAEALRQVPLERVWELHLAGGMPMGSYWLDAHSGAVPEPVMALAAEWLPRLPQLGAIIFEILPEHVPRLGLDGVARQLERLQALWALRPPRTLAVPRLHAAARRRPAASSSDLAAVAAWESALVDTLRGQVRPGFGWLAADPGVALLAELVADFRRASLSKVLRYTLTLLLGTLGEAETAALLAAYLVQHPPDSFAAVEAEQFTRFLAAHEAMLRRVPHLAEVLAFEQALLRATLYGESRQLRWSVDPAGLFEALEAGRVPAAQAALPTTMLITTA
ncbi:DUF692 domain-containing protein [Eleftheria terrae]|uniref:DUF692 domain-containing protein n=1 Tax=Eleftheria terrae TaxID=1597781 RepID=UPI00263BDE66|nr:DUF692 family multinuclear iron-containing protein [Eleftheria terrae]WKB53078.1 DUF692 domain-containing protein [Eleftheria terrae]